MPAVAFIDGAVVPLAEARVPVTDRGFLWGDHVFEVVRAVGGHLCDGDAHLARLARSAEAIGLPAPDRARIGLAIAACLAAAGEVDAAVRVVWTGGDGGRLARAGAAARLVIVVEAIAPGLPSPVRLHLLGCPRVGGLVPAGAKTGNYLPSILALAAAAAAGADDAVFVDGDVALETASASLFVVDRAGAVATCTGALLPGVTAARVADLLGGLGHPVARRPVPVAALHDAAELFTTSARRGVVPVIAVDGVARAPGPVTGTAADAYARWIAAVARGSAAGAL